MFSAISNKGTTEMEGPDDSRIYLELLRADARTKKSAIPIAGNTDRLLRDKRIKRYKNRYYLTPIGYICAAGAILSKKEEGERVKKW